MAINWYPGHIAKAERKLKEQVKLVDVVFEVLDARIPASSLYDNLDKLLGNKPRLMLLNKSDVSDPDSNSKWMKYLEEKTGQKVIMTSATSGKDISSVIKDAIELGRPEIEKLVAKGRLPRPIRAMVVGMPNVGKSSIINKLIKTAKVKVGAKAGITRAAQWVRINPKLELMDTPGIIPMKLDTQERAFKLAMVNSVGEASYDKIEVANTFISLVYERYPQFFCDYYRLKCETIPTIEEVAIARNLLVTAGKPDVDRCASLVLTDFRQGRIGRITLEDTPPIEN
ncbi:MAG TPA: ribosome biogenesis GTPase YlqF [Cyanobacteria bacterium UBA9971]|nr:ribosome biogenesis GTPase YlqF [Cyanobacteria bacterium UBA9971]